jgi:LmbE family N-acetylglucosaminyl deacetylase
LDGGVPAIIRVPVICFAAHPDDETIGAGGHLFYWPEVRIVHATDGAPRDMEDACRYGFATREAYAEARHDELVEALKLAGIDPERATSLGIVDQECCRNLVPMTGAILDLLNDVRPATVLAPSYEGGHPDHDSLVFGVHSACRLLGERTPRILEYALYHAAAGDFRSGEFIPIPGTRSISVELSRRASSIKRRMLECFVTQQNTLAPFQTAIEKFRVAPVYDFSKSPHPGTLFYDHFPWGVKSAEWRHLAAEATREFGL